MGRSGYLGEFEQIVLLAVARLGDEAYGMRIRAEIEARAGRKATIGAVYATLERLVAKGHVRQTGPFLASRRVRLAHVTLGDQPLERRVNSADCRLPSRPRFDLGPNPHAGRLVAEPRDREEHDLLELAEIAAASHRGYDFYKVELLSRYSLRT